jgi:hypothetical protein
MYRIVKLTQDDVDEFLVIHAIKGKEVARFETYKEALNYVLAK